MAASTKLPKTVHTLSHFIRRQRVLSLYRQFFRLTRPLSDQQQKEEIRNWIRVEFHNAKHITDNELIEMNLTRANDALRELEISLRHAHTLK